jgi:uncharacterized protein (DUF1800 family)
MNTPEDRTKIQHLYNRMSFGYPLMSVEEVSLKQARKDLIELNADFKDIQVTESSRMNFKDRSSLSPEERKKLIKGKQEEFRVLNAEWINTLSGSKALLREKLAFFWHGHFACRSGFPSFMEEMVNTLRKVALSDFKTIITGVSKNAAMLQFLNNQQNRKASPNENFARELLELFTLGRGHYTEQDIKESARAFTGWGFNEDGVFEFRERQHDFGTKTFLGETGNWDGDDIIRIILKQKQCARFICSKIWRSFISDIEEPDKIEKLADSYFKSDYNTKQLFSEIVNSEWFYEEKYRGARIKSPVELVVPLVRDFKLEFANENLLFNIQRILGQVLLYPPNVAGWPGGQNWIDSSSLVYRMKLPRILLSNDVSEIAPKDDGDVNGFSRIQKKTGTTERIKVNANWENIFTSFLDLDSDELIGSISRSLMSTTSFVIDKELLKKYATASDKRDQIKLLVLHFMTLPEYQLC